MVEAAERYIGRKINEEEIELALAKKADWQGKKRLSCFFYYLLLKNTVDEIIYKCVIEKADKTKLFERLIKSASKHGLSKRDIAHYLSASDEIRNIAVNENVLAGYC